MDQILKLISGLSLKQRISIIVAALAVAAGLVELVHYRHDSDFRPLYTGMQAEDAAGVVQKLRETGVEYRLAENGGAVMVPSEKLAESRLALAAAGLPKTGRIGFELFDKNNFGATEFVEHINYKRALEGELERTVMTLAEVEQSRVHLTLPKESVFLDQEQPAKASVMLKLKPGASISPQNILAITNLVASAVEGLSPDSVSVVDTDGALLSRPKKAHQDSAEATSESLEVRQQLEKNLVAKINQTLEPLLGATGFRAGASIDYDLTSGEQQEETLDPDHSVMVSSQKSEDISERSAAAGVPGTASNLPKTQSASKAGGNGVSRRTENITYQTSRVIRHTQIPQGVVKRMSLAVLVNQTVQWEGSGADRRRVLVPPTPETLKTIRDLVAAVTGFNEQRGDQLTVETLPFESSLHAEPPKPPAPAPRPGPKPPAWLEFLNNYRDLLLPAVIALGMLAMLVFALFRFRRPSAKEKKAVAIADELEGPAAVPELSAGAAGLAAAAAGAPALLNHDELSERVRVAAKRDPELAVNVLRIWLQEARQSAPQSQTAQQSS